MAGGSGTRLWPASNSKTPKQFLSIPGGNTFFYAALERSFAVMDEESEGNLVIVAGAAHEDHILASCASLPDKYKNRIRLILEPQAKNTAPAIACAVGYLRKTLGWGRRALVLTSDHIIDPIESFSEDAALADEFAAQGKLVVFGIPPQRPETGYGYIERGQPILSQRLKQTKARGFKLASFREKPDSATAKQFLSTGTFLWNSGMFGFSVDAMVEEFRRSSPETLEPFEALKAPENKDMEVQKGIRVLKNWQGLAEAYETVKPISIDHGVAEKCSDAAVVAARFNWLDIGSWDEYARFMGTSRGEIYESGSNNCFVDSDLPVALCGVEDLMVIVRSGADGGPPAVLVCKKGEAQRVKDIVTHIKAHGKNELL